MKVPRRIPAAGPRQKPDPPSPVHTYSGASDSLKKVMPITYYAQPICLYLTQHARISGEILIIAQSVVHKVIPTTSSFPMIGLPSLEKGMIPAHVLSISRSRRSGNTSEACSLLAVTLSEGILGKVNAQCLLLVIKLWKVNIRDNSVQFKFG